MSKNEKYEEIEMMWITTALMPLERKVIFNRRNMRRGQDDGKKLKHTFVQYILIIIYNEQLRLWRLDDSSEWTLIVE